MSRATAERSLPASLLERASLRGDEYAWPVQDIPAVIDAARAAGLISVGGQLQFRIPNGGTCEIHYVEVDTYRDVATSVPWPERVEQTAEAALAQFNALPGEYDFVAEGRKGFAEELARFELGGGKAKDAMCFVWYVKAPDEGA